MTSLASVHFARSVLKKKAQNRTIQNFDRRVQIVLAVRGYSPSPLRVTRPQLGWEPGHITHKYMWVLMHATIVCAINTCSCYTNVLRFIDAFLTPSTQIP